jgi:hypothetical protein
MPAASVRGGRTDAIALRRVISRAPMRPPFAWQHRGATWLPGPFRPWVRHEAGAIVDSSAASKEV